MREKIELKILYVEDDQMARESAYSYLHHRVTEISFAMDGVEGVHFFKENSPDVVITDIAMPNMDGLEMSRRIREINADIPIFITTAFTEISYFQQAVDIGIDHYCAKPVNMGKLFVALKKLAEKNRQERLIKKQNQELTNYKNAIDSSVIVSKADLKGNIIYVNDMFCEISGYEREELIGKPHNIVRHPSMPSSVFKELWETIQQKKVWRGRVTNRKKDGGRYIVETTIVPLLDENGEIQEYFSLRKDVTEFVEVGRKLRQKEMEKQEQEREHLEEINRAKDQFLMVFTHELKTPLNAIINLSEIVARQLERHDELDDKDQMIEYLMTVSDNGNKMLEHVVNLLDMYRIKTDKLKIEIADVNLSDVLRGVKHRFSYDLGKNHTNVDFLLPDNPIIIQSDVVRCIQIVNNLFSNALKYGNDKIRVSATVKEGQFYFAIEDNGKGFIEKEKVLQLFEQNEDNMYQRENEGLGVGLHYVYLLSEKLGYDLKIGDSNSLGGAKVIISGSLE